MTTSTNSPATGLDSIANSLNLPNIPSLNGRQILFTGVLGDSVVTVQAWVASIDTMTEARDSARVFIRLKHRRDLITIYSDDHMSRRQKIAVLVTRLPWAPSLEETSIEGSLKVL